MNLAYLNGEFTPLDQAKISPLDRGFLFGDGVYEVVPCYEKKFVGWSRHLQRMVNGLGEIKIPLTIAPDELFSIAQRIVNESPDSNVGIYIQITRGAAPVRKHAFPDKVIPTIFVTGFAIPALAEKHTEITPARVQSQRDIRWSRCDIKSVSLLGSVLHYQSAHEQGLQETLLYDEQRIVKEASTSNVFIVKGGVVYTPPLSNELLPGITREVLISILKDHSNYQVIEQAITLDDVYHADECWITSASRGVAPIIECDGKPIADGNVGKVAKELTDLYRLHMFSY